MMTALLDNPDRPVTERRWLLADCRSAYDRLDGRSRRVT